MTGQRRAHGEPGGLAVADLADQDHVRVLAEDRPQAAAEGQPAALVDLDLGDAGHLDLDRVLEGDDVPLGQMDVGDRGVQRVGLARPGGTGDQDQALQGW